MLLKALAWLLARLPAWAIEPLARIAAWTWWTVLPVRRRLAAESFRAAFPQLPPGPHLRRAMRDLCGGFLEWLRQPVRGDVDVEIVGFEPVAERLAAGEGVILAAGHTLVWELGGAELSRRRCPGMVCLVKLPSDPAARELNLALRRWYGVELVPAAPGAIGRIVRRLREGAVAAFHVDQRHNQGLVVPFLGRPAWSSPAAAVVAARSGAPVYGLGYERLGPRRHRVTVHRELPMSGDVKADTAALQAFVGELIRATPHNWLWLHDRWRQP